ncbi:DUF86 domain-containing protein [uncultured Sphingomonas sp.]|uniref:HepT-like ribonuclease domain-containing protein n=1 Tax=uncultured Sphingomonas sp. TaxID=158754 RepID=UPI0035CC5D91
MLSKKTIRRLGDIIEDADRITTFIEGMSLAEFLGRELTIFAVERLLQRVTEATIQIDVTDAAQIGDIPFAKMRAFGNLLRHEYREIDRSVVFHIAPLEVPLVRAAAELAIEANEY